MNYNTGAHADTGYASVLRIQIRERTPNQDTLECCEIEYESARRGYVAVRRILIRERALTGMHFNSANSNTGAHA